ncbi:MAG: hypothetical protein ABL955_08475 [Elusimicrobiota bacterium]
MKQCPDCRSPILSLMFLDSNPEPKPYCERCCRAVTAPKAPAPAPREAVLV